ncbi:hypothetical protein TIFTF001_021467 [Ficus carica]|uniref:F-box domain-containing protein n=1 Tax=Ficus carica TaxID=3494 RepID=A0AA88DDN8_FICCA|nr:hypothetical protein TIFTF001_021467 [Ficus carica]
MKRNNIVKVGDDFSSNENPDFKLVSKFLKNVSEDMLLEIFLRLPNCRSAILFSSVCRRWNSVISHPKFILNFVCHHHDRQDRYSLPYTILFLRSDVYTSRGVQCYQPFYKLFSEESKVLHDKAASSYLDFLPSPMVVRASFDDLLLVEPGTRREEYYICNLLTKQCFQIPKIPRGCPIGFALVRVPDSSNEPLGFSTTKTQYQYKVVLIHFALHLEEDGDNDRFRVSIFCSKSRQWRQSFFSFPRAKEIKYCNYTDVVTCNGILYWRESDFTFDRIIAFDLFNDRCFVIELPDDFGSGWQNSFGKVHLGAVRGELRLFQIFNTNEECLVMKVWELNYEDYLSNSWTLVHEINLKRANTQSMLCLAVHPSSDDVVFMIWGYHVFQYKITEDRYEKVGELETSIDPNERFSSIPLVHPAWPTPVPSHLPSV